MQIHLDDREKSILTSYTNCALSAMTAIFPALAGYYALHKDTMPTWLACVIGAALAVIVLLLRWTPQIKTTVKVLTGVETVSQGLGEFIQETQQQQLPPVSVGAVAVGITPLPVAPQVQS